MHQQPKTLLNLSRIYHNATETCSVEIQASTTGHLEGSVGVA